MVAAHVVFEVGVGQALGFKGLVDAGALVLDPQLLGLRFSAGREFVEEHHFTQVVPDAFRLA